MAYDDIAMNKNNPFKGKLFNKPDGEDVYAGCKIDWLDVKPENFLAILAGDSTKEITEYAFPHKYLYAD